MTLDGLCIRLRDLTNRRLARFEPTRVKCLNCDEYVSEWVTIRWQLTNKDHWPSTDGRNLAQLCLPCAVPAVSDLGEAIEDAVRRTMDRFGGRCS